MRFSHPGWQANQKCVWDLYHHRTLALKIAIKTDTGIALGSRESVSTINTLNEITAY